MRTARSSDAGDRAIAAAEARRCCASGGPRRGAAASRCEEIERRRDADGPVQRAQLDGADRDAAGQLRLLRPHAGRARRGDVGRLRAHRAGAGRQPAGRGSRDPRQRQQDAHERSSAAARATRRDTASCSTRSTASVPIGSSSSSGCLKSTPTSRSLGERACARRPRPHHSESLLRRCRTWSTAHGRSMGSMCRARSRLRRADGSRSAGSAVVEWRSR